MFLPPLNFSAFSFIRLPNCAHSPTQFLSSPISKFIMNIKTIFLIESFQCLLELPWNKRCGFLVLCKYHSPTSPLGLMAPEGSSRRCRVKQACLREPCAHQTSTSNSEFCFWPKACDIRNFEPYNCELHYTSTNLNFTTDMDQRTQFWDTSVKYSEPKNYGIKLRSKIKVRERFANSG